MIVDCMNTNCQYEINETDECTPVPFLNIQLSLYLLGKFCSKNLHQVAKKATRFLIIIEVFRIML